MGQNWAPFTVYKHATVTQMRPKPLQKHNQEQNKVHADEIW